MGEVEHDINENEGDAKNKDPEDQVQSKEPEEGNADLIAKHKNLRKRIFDKYVLNRNKLWKKNFSTAGNLLLLSRRMSTCSGDRSV